MTDEISDRLSEAIAIISKLVAFDTESVRSNAPLIDWVQDFLHARGLNAVRLPNSRGDKAALFASFGPAVDGGVLLSGHTDVVPTAGQKWSSNPLQLRRDGSRIYGRGVCDMKGFLGLLLAMSGEFAQAQLRKPIHFLLTYDEETTCLGPMDAIAQFGERLLSPGCVIVGEPTMMRVVDEHKSVSCYVTRVLGKEGHSSRPDLGVSAIAIGCALVTELYRVGRELGRSESRFDPPGSTVSVGRIAGGAARNIIARECSFEWEFRGEPSVSPESAFRKLEDFIGSGALARTVPAAGAASIHTTCEISIPGLRSDPNSEAAALALRLTRTNQTYAMPFATEAGRFQAAGFPAVVCGPGNIDQAHQPDEFVEISQLAACIAFLRSLIQELSAP